MLITSSGQVTIPKKLRHILGFVPGVRVGFEVVGDTLVLTKIDDPQLHLNSILEAMRSQQRTEDIIQIMQKDAE